MATQTQRHLRAGMGKDNDKKASGAESITRDALIENLNRDLAGEYQAILTYIHYAAKLTGPYRNELRSLLQSEVADEQRHAQFLADKIAALDGQPTNEHRPVPQVR
jgi:bacterioferritin